MVSAGRPLAAQENAGTTVSNARRSHAPSVQALRLLNTGQADLAPVCFTPKQASRCTLATLLITGNVLAAIKPAPPGRRRSPPAQLQIIRLMHHGNHVPTTGGGANKSSQPDWRLCVSQARTLNAANASVATAVSVPVRFAHEKGPKCQHKRHQRHQPGPNPSPDQRRNQNFL